MEFHCDVEKGKMVSILKGDKWIADIQGEKTQIANVLNLACFNNLGIFLS